MNRGGREGGREGVGQINLDNQKLIKNTVSHMVGNRSMAESALCRPIDFGIVTHVEDS